MRRKRAGFAPVAWGFAGWHIVCGVSERQAVVRTVVSNLEANTHLGTVVGGVREMGNNRRSVGSFRCAFFAHDYRASCTFYGEGLRLPVETEWNRGPHDCGTLFRVNGGTIEVLARPRDQPADAVWDYRSPQGMMLVVEVADVEATYHRACVLELAVREPLGTQRFGHLSCILTDPDGIMLYLYTPRPVE